MFDLEERLRAEARQEAGAFVPSSDLPQRVVTGIRRRRQRRIALASAAAVLVVGLGAAGVAALSGDTGQIRMAPPANQPGGTSAPTTATTAPPSTTTTTATSSTQSTAEPGDPSDTPSSPAATATEPTTTTAAPESVTPALAPGAPLSRSGVGPIEAGMTIREAEAAGGIVLSVNPEAWSNYGSYCGVFTTAGTDKWFVATTPGEVPSDDPKTAVIDAIGSETSQTEEGIAAGATYDDLVATYGEPTNTIPHPTNSNQEILLFWSGDFSYGFLVEGGVVKDLRSGHVGGVAAFEPCIWGGPGA